MYDRVYDHAREEIRKALVQEYLKKHPGVREQDVMLACVNGELVFTHLAAVLADIKIRKQFSHSLRQASNMFAELAIHQDERWKDCVESVQHSRQIIDCLFSSNFNYFNQAQWSDEHNILKNLEGNCARKTVQLHESSKNMTKLKTRDAAERTSKARNVIIEYLNLVVDQLSVLHEVLQKEVELGDIFNNQSQKYIETNFPKVEKKPIGINIEEVDKIYKALKGDKKVSLKKVVDLNANMLVETKNALAKAVDEMKESLKERREQFHQIWSTITQLQEVVKQLEKVQEMDKKGELPSPDNNDSSKSQDKGPRMTRFLSKFKRR